MSKKLITLKRLREMTKSVLNFLERENIDSIECIEKRLGEFFDIKKRDDITLESKLSESGTKAYTIIYIDYKVGIPIEIQMNPSLNYSRVIVKTNTRLSDYVFSEPDSFGNLMQYKKVGGYSISEIKKELEKLIS